MPCFSRFRSWLPYSMDVFMYGGREGLWTTLIVKERFVIGKVCPCLQKDEKFDSSHCPTTEIASSSSVLWSQPVAARGTISGGWHTGASRRDQRKARLLWDSPTIARGSRLGRAPLGLAYLLVPLGLLPRPAVCS